MTRDTICIVIILLALAGFFHLAARHNNQPDRVASPEIKRIMAYHGVSAMEIDHNGYASIYRGGKKINLGRVKP